MVSKDGYFPGSHVVLNSGLASHGGGDNRGLSKAVCMVAVLFSIPANYAYDISWNLAWTPINTLFFNKHFRPMFIAICKAIDDQFWVCLTKLKPTKCIF